MVRFSVYVVWPSVLSLNNIEVFKIHKTKAVKNISKNYTSVNFYNPGLVLTASEQPGPVYKKLT